MTEQCRTSPDRRFSGRQITIMVVAVCVTIIATPFAALAAAGNFSSNSSSTPAVSAKNTASGSGAKAVSGNATASGGTIYGVYGRAGSPQGYGVYSAGRLGSSGTLVCSHCVKGSDVDAASMPTVPSAHNAAKLGGFPADDYARIIPLSWRGAADSTPHLQANIDGLNVYEICTPDDHGGNISSLEVSVDPGADGTINWFMVPKGSTADANGFPFSASLGRVAIVDAGATVQVEGSLIYRNNSTTRVVTVDFHLYGNSCELFGDILAAG